jgi:hypothetical protein
VCARATDRPLLNRAIARCRASYGRTDGRTSWVPHIDLRQPITRQQLVPGSDSSGPSECYGRCASAKHQSHLSAARTFGRPVEVQYCQAATWRPIFGIVVVDVVVADDVRRCPACRRQTNDRPPIELHSFFGRRIGVVRGRNSIGLRDDGSGLTSDRRTPTNNGTVELTDVD